LKERKRKREFLKPGEVFIGFRKPSFTPSLLKLLAKSTTTQ
jgi:hypothetical protein